MRRHLNRYPTSVPYTPKFQPGERVQVSAKGREWEAAKAGSIGTVEDCRAASVSVRIDGSQHGHYYLLDFWEPLP